MRVNPKLGLRHARRFALGKYACNATPPCFHKPATNLPLSSVRNPGMASPSNVRIRHGSFVSSTIEAIISFALLPPLSLVICVTHISISFLPKYAKSMFTIRNTIFIEFQAILFLPICMKTIASKHDLRLLSTT